MKQMKYFETGCRQAEGTINNCDNDFIEVTVQMRRIIFGAAAVVLAAGAMLASHPAEAWWRGGGFFYGPPVFIGPPVVYAPPPVYYAPGPVYGPGPTYGPAGQACYAGPYVCPLDQPTPAGAQCSCPANQGRVYGQAR